MEVYVKRYINRRLQNIYQTDLGRSSFLEDIFYWDEFKKKDNDSLGHFFKQKRVKKLIKGHETLLIKWLKFIQE